MEKRLIGFCRANGTHWCFRSEDGIHYEPVCIVKNNGDIRWTIEKELLTKEEIFIIAKNSMKEKRKIREWEETLSRLAEEIKLLATNSKDYFIKVHSLEWHKEALRIANI